MLYKVTKKFIEGTLKGLEAVEITGIRFELGQYYGGHTWLGPRYQVVAVQEIPGR